MANKLILKAFNHFKKDLQKNDFNIRNIINDNQKISFNLFKNGLFLCRLTFLEDHFFIKYDEINTENMNDDLLILIKQIANHNNFIIFE